MSHFLEFDDGKEVCPTYEINLVETNNPPLRDEVASLQDEDESLWEIKQYLEGGVLPKEWKGDELKVRFRVEEGVLYHMWRPTTKQDLGGEIKQLVPVSQRGRVLLANHEECNHPGYIRT